MNIYMYKGVIHFHLNNLHFEILKLFIEFFFDENELILTNNKIEFLTEKTEEIEEIFSFLDFYGTVTFSELFCLNYDQNVQSFIEVKNGRVLNYDYFFDMENSYLTDINYFIKTFLTEEIIDFELSPPNPNLEQKLMLLKYGEYDRAKLSKEILKTLEEIKLNISFFFKKEEIVLYSFNKKCEVIPFVKSPFPTTIYPVEKKFLTLGKINENDSRRIYIDNKEFLFFEGMMKLYKEKQNVILPTNTITNSCSQCLNRIRKTTNGCPICLPIKIPI